MALVDVREGLIPHRSIYEKTGDERAQMIEESKRLLYVGITRAKKILLFVTHNQKSPPGCSI